MAGTDESSHRDAEGGAENESLATSTLADAVWQYLDFKSGHQHGQSIVKLSDTAPVIKDEFNYYTIYPELYARMLHVISKGRASRERLDALATKHASAVMDFPNPLLEPGDPYFEWRMAVLRKEFVYGRREFLAYTGRNDQTPHLPVSLQDQAAQSSRKTRKRGPEIVDDAETNVDRAYKAYKALHGRVERLIKLKSRCAKRRAAGGSGPQRIT